MKKIFLPAILFAAYLLPQSVHAQNVGIGTTTPVDKLSVQTLDNTYGMTHTNGVVTVGSYIGSGYGWLGTKSNHPLAFFTSNGSAAMTIATNGMVGIGNLAATNRLQIGQTPGFSGNDIAIGNGVQAMSFFQSSTASTWYSNNNFALMPNGSHGYVGIGTATPVNFLQIGSVGSNGYTGNAIAIGNGTSAMVFNQQTLEADWQSNSQIYLKPQNGGVLGRVYNTGSEYITGSAVIGNNATISGNASILGTANIGGATTISSTTPNVAGLSVSGSYYTSTSAPNSSLTHCSGFCGTFDLSIQATGSIFAEAFYALSDARYKDIKGFSNSASDLEILNKIKITNYSLKDKMVDGGKMYKKVIAQQVEEVYPQVVAKAVNYLPNVYQSTIKVTKTAEGYLLGFKDAHHIDKDATKLQLMDNNKQVHCDIVSIPSEKEVLIKYEDLKDNTVFVYGEQVNDFRTVDYEGLSTLNISATQELSKKVKQQDLIIKEQNEKIASLSAKVDILMGGVKKL